MTIFDTAQALPEQPFYEPVKIYAGLLGQIGDIIMFTPTLRRIKEIFPNSFLTVPVSSKYREAGLLIEELPYVDRMFVTELYFERQRDITYGPWHMGWPVDLRGGDEVVEERRHDIVLQTRPRHKRMPWWEYGHQTEVFAHMVGVPGPIDPRVEIVIPSGTQIPAEAGGRIVFHNDSTIDQTKCVVLGAGGGVCPEGWRRECCAAREARARDAGYPGPSRHHNTLPGSCNYRIG